MEEDTKLEDMEPVKTEPEIIKLNEGEVRTVKDYQKAIENERLNLAQLRMQYLSSEQLMIENLKKMQEDFQSYVRIVSQSKSIPQPQNWLLDLSAYVFRKK